MAAAAKTQKFKAEVGQVLHLVINSLYSDKDIFLRELISNAADALDKLRFEALSKPELLPEGYEPRIRLIPDKVARTLTIWDNGIGMSAAALSKDLGTVAHSGTREFAEKLAAAQQGSAATLIGQFGVGFYSGYLVADKVEVVSRAAGTAEANRWSSDGKESFAVEPAERDSIGTSVILHLKGEHEGYCDEWKLRELVRRYSDFISHKIELRVAREGQDEKLELINQASALWMRPKSEVTEEQYNELYKHLTHDWEQPLAHTHFQVEGTQMFTGLLFLPKRPPFDMMSPDAPSGVRLYVRRVFIMDECDALLPRWLRFVRGVIDSDDLPLNVSRELLQDSSLVRTIKKQVSRRVLDLLVELAENKPDEYLDFFHKFGAVLKEGLHFDPSYKDKLQKLVRYESTRGEGLRSLAQYVEGMKEGQKAIYYAIGPSKALLEHSPQLEGLRGKGYEILLMTDGVDQWAVEGLGELEGKPFVNAMEEGLSLDGEAPKPDDEDGEESKPAAKDPGELGPLLERCKQILSDSVGEVRLSDRLTDSPVCLVLPKGGLPAHIERLMRAHQADLPAQKRILELNPKHPLMARMQAEHARDASSPKLQEWVEMLYDQALLSEGSPLPDPVRFAARVAALMQNAS
jgi:molecular chaperone HtpG